MKQGIDVDQLKEITLEQRLVLNNWYQNNIQIGDRITRALINDLFISDMENIVHNYDKKYIYQYETDWGYNEKSGNEFEYLNTVDIPIKECLPLMNIGQMIQFLQDNSISQNQICSYVLQQMSWCDALWKLVKESI
jgi:hypothetical protein